jgi:transcriptional regulator with XRE-family HTH domain
MKKKPSSAGLLEIHVALILLRFRTRKTQREVAVEAGVAVNSVCHAEAGGTGGGWQGSIGTLDSLLTCYGADLALCHKLLQVARRHLGDLSRIDSPTKLPRRKADEIWAEMERLPRPRPDTSWTRKGNPES